MPLSHRNQPDRAFIPTSAAAVQECRDRFVVTQVWTPDGRTMLTHRVIEPQASGAS